LVAIAGAGAASRRLTCAVASTAAVVGKHRMRTLIQRGVLPEAPLRAGLRAICTDARADGVPIERLLREVTQAISCLCDACAVPHGESRTTFTNRLVTICIEEY
jgi:hypothetical protein